MTTGNTSNPSAANQKKTSLDSSVLNLFWSTQSKVLSAMVFRKSDQSLANAIRKPVAALLRARADHGLLIECLARLAVSQQVSMAAIREMAIQNESSNPSFLAKNL